MRKKNMMSEFKTNDKNKCVYKITNTITNECYIGQTNNFNHRMSQHKSCKYYQTKLSKNIIEYGWRNFTKEILINDLTQYEADVIEYFYIQEFDAELNINGRKIIIKDTRRQKILDLLESIICVSQNTNILKDDELKTIKNKQLLSEQDKLDIQKNVFARTLHKQKLELKDIEFCVVENNLKKLKTFSIAQMSKKEVLKIKHYNLKNFNLFTNEPVILAVSKLLHTHNIKIGDDCITISKINKIYDVIYKNKQKIIDAGLFDKKALKENKNADEKMMKKTITTLLSKFGYKKSKEECSSRQLKYEIDLTIKEYYQNIINNKK